MGIVSRSHPIKSGTMILVASLVWSLSACTTTDEIIIDERRSNMTNYERDLADCEGYAEGVPVGEKAARGAGSGAVVGGAIGAVSDRNDAGEGASIGAIAGGAAGINHGQREKVQVVKRCLRGRGYAVLN
ncbi:MAG TPA: hypothetical protein VJ984_14785 [Xanthomonadales bacterium]|nr:hypothetical protein [Xanthomonadales bacterium]